MSTQEIDLLYVPRDQFVPLHETDKRWKVVVAHRRSGKTVSSLNELIRGALLCPKASPRFAYISPYRTQSKAIAWSYLKDFTSNLPNRRVSESELYVELPRGARVTLYGADNSESLRGIYLDGCVIDEPADMDPNFFRDVIRPALSDRLGWCLWIGTPKGRNSFFSLYDNACSDSEYFTMFLPASVSGLLPVAELQSALRSMGKESYEREYECSFAAAIPGAIYGDEISKLRSNNQIQDFAPATNLPMDTFWDVGDSDYTCIWLVQMEGRHINLVDYYSANGQTVGHYANQIKKWGETYQTSIRTNFLPHDADHVRRGGSWKTDLTEAGLSRITIVPRTPDIWLGINELRSILPRCYIHKTNCSRRFGDKESSAPSGLDCLEYYHKREESDQNVIYEKPVHDEFSHGADALRTMSEAHRLGMLEGSSYVARNSRHTPIRVLRGPSSNSYKRKNKVKSIR